MFSPNRFGAESATSSAFSSPRSTSPGPTRTTRVGQGSLAGGVGESTSPGATRTNRTGQRSLAGAVGRSTSPSSRSTSSTGLQNRVTVGRGGTGNDSPSLASGVNSPSRARAWGADRANSTSVGSSGQRATSPSSRWVNNTSYSTNTPSSSRFGATTRSTSPSALSTTSTGWRGRTPDSQASRATERRPRSPSPVQARGRFERPALRTSPSRFRDLNTTSSQSTAPKVSTPWNSSAGARSRTVSPGRDFSTKTDQRSRSPSAARDFSTHANTATTRSTSPNRNWSTSTGLNSSRNVDRDDESDRDADRGVFHSTSPPRHSTSRTGLLSTSPTRSAHLGVSKDERNTSKSGSTSTSRFGGKSGSDADDDSGTSRWPGVKLKNTRHGQRIKEEDKWKSSSPLKSTSGDKSANESGGVRERDRSRSPGRRVASSDDKKSSRLSRSTEVRPNRNAAREKSNARDRSATRERDVSEDRNRDRTLGSRPREGSEGRSNTGLGRLSSLKSTIRGKFRSSERGKDGRDKDVSQSRSAPETKNVTFGGSDNNNRTPSFVRPRQSTKNNRRGNK